VGITILNQLKDICMPWDDDGKNDGNKDTPKGTKGPWGSGTNKGRRTGDQSGNDARGQKDDSPPNPWARRANPPSSGGNNIDELIDAIQDRINRVISGGGSFPKGGGPKGVRPKGGKGTLILLGLGAFLLWLGTGLYRVQEGEVGVVLRFGEMVRTSLPGLQYHLPAPFESVIVQKVAAVNTIDGGMKADKNSDSGESNLILTGDENMVHTNYTILWKIKDVSEYLFTARDPDETIRVAAESVIREVIGQTTARLALTEGRGQIEAKSQEILQKLLDQYKMGVQIVSIQLQNVAPPHQVVDAFNDLQASLVNADQSRNEAEAYKNEILPRAEGQAAQIINEATAYRQSKIAEAEGEAGRFKKVLATYELYPVITLKRYYIEMAESILKKATIKYIVDDRLGKGIVPYLPLNELKSNASVAASVKKDQSR
jgi:modulator of FtsH protease HflK